MCSSSKTGIVSVVLFIFSLCACRNVSAASPFEIDDAVQFAKIIDTNSAVVVTNATLPGVQVEGVAWWPLAGFVVFCELQNSKLDKWTTSNGLSLFHQYPSNTKINGSQSDFQGRLISCMAGGGTGGQRVIMTDTNGNVTSLCTNYNGLAFDSPNDLIVKRDGSIWFTDPGADNSATPQPGHYVYYFYPTNLSGNNVAIKVITNMSTTNPNGIVFSPDETKLYVTDTAGSANNIRVFNVSPSNTVDAGTLFANVSIPDGSAGDVDGRLWVGAGDGVEIYAPDGHLIGKILTGLVSHAGFGDADWQTMYFVGQEQGSGLGKLCSVRVKVHGLLYSRLSQSLTMQLTNQIPQGATAHAVVNMNFATHSDDLTTNGSTTYLSGNPGIMTVNSNGLVTAVAGYGSAQIIASFGGRQATNTVAVFVPPPVLQAAAGGSNQVFLKWTPGVTNNFVLQYATNLVAGSNYWLNDTNPVGVAGGNRVVTNDTAAPQKFYRLKYP